MKRLLLLLFGSLILTGCSEEKAAEMDGEKAEETDVRIEAEDLIHSFQHPESGQSYQIIDAYKLYGNYINALDKNTGKSEKDLYQQEVIDPVYQQCFADGEFSHMAESITGQVPHSLDRVMNLNEKIENSQYVEHIKEALFKSSDLLPANKETNVCIFPSISRTNSAAVTVGSGKIIILYSQYYTEEFLKAVTAHEYHHSVWAEKFLKSGNQQTVLDNLVFEGKAVMFEKVVYPDIQGTRINEDYNKKYWAKIEGDLNSTNFYQSMEIIFGGNGLPPLYGYSEGYKMVKSYIDYHPESEPLDWTGLSGKEIFEEGRYREHYQ
ncbi:DUF2268 domain-containing putative Zn-dependent protease [Rossellomorea vietnamensis]|uniref:DUF2268 domain-containing putative Zn-dependent protease n=1 Tax=Rossellomorea vietnamensis TaxID=218284 RepID=UPI003CF3B572